MDTATATAPAETAPAETATEPGTDIEAITNDPSLPLLQPLTFDTLYDHLKAEADALEADLTTDKGRKAIASMAFKIARTKTAIDDAGKKLNEEARARIAAVDAERRKIRDRLDALRDEVRRPLTEWENAEKQRQARVEETKAWLTRAAVVLADATAASLAERLETVRRINISEEIFGEDAAALAEQRAGIIGTLQTAEENARRQEAERAELEKLRREKQEREEADKLAARQSTNAERALNRIAQLAKTEGDDLPVAALQRRRDALYQEFGTLTADESAGEYGTHAGRVQAACADAEQKLARAITDAQAAHEEALRRQAAEEAAAKERAAAEEKAAKERAEADRQQRVFERKRFYAQAAVIREDDTPETLNARLAEVDSLEINAGLFGEDAPDMDRMRADTMQTLHAAFDRKAAEQREREDAAKRQADELHREAVHGKIRAALESAGIGTETARVVVLAIAAGEIPHVTINY